ETQGKIIVASIDGQSAAFGAHEDIEVSLTHMRLTVSGETAALKNLRIREAMPSDTWEATKAKLLQARKQARYGKSEARLMRITGVLPLLCLAIVGSAARAAGPPNIVYIMADDHAAHAISAYGTRLIKTPHLDRIAKEGMRFNHCFATNAL